MLRLLLFRTILLANTSLAQKKGINYSKASDISLCSSGCSNINWAYNYGQTSNGGTSGLEFVPMLRDTSSLSSWAANAQADFASGSKYVLGFNEPDLNGISPAAAASLWIAYMNPRTNYKKVSPSVSASTASGQGLNWLATFLSACSGCDIDYIGIHWYGSVSDTSSLQSYIVKTTSMFPGRPIWVTELGYTDGTDAQKAAALTSAVKYLGSNSNVFRYAYFWCAANSLLGPAGAARSQTGAAYCSLKT